MEQDIPDYDMDSEDERWLESQAKKLELTPLKFEEMMDQLEKSSGQTVVTLNEAKALLKEDDDLIIAVFDYWLNKRLKTVTLGDRGPPEYYLLIAATSPHPVGEDRAQDRHGGQQSVPGVPQAHGEDADAQEPEERRDVLREDAEAAQGPHEGRHAPGAGQAPGEDQARVRPSHRRNLREALSGEGLQWCYYFRTVRSESRDPTRFHAHISEPLHEPELG